MYRHYWALHLSSQNFGADLTFNYPVIWSHQIKAVLHLKVFENLWRGFLCCRTPCGPLWSCTATPWSILLSTHRSLWELKIWLSRLICTAPHQSDLLDSSLIFPLFFFFCPAKTYQNKPLACWSNMCSYRMLLFRWVIAEEACRCGRLTGCSPTRTPQLLGPASTVHVLLLWSVFLTWMDVNSETLSPLGSRCIWNGCTDYKLIVFLSYFSCFFYSP